MTEHDVYVELTELLRTIFNDASLAIHASTTAHDVSGWDSLTHLNVIVAVERRFRIRFDFDEITRLRTVGDLVTSVMAKHA